MKEAIQFKQYKIFTPEMALKMEPGKLMGIATQASALINKLGGEHMFHPPPEALCAYLQAGMACYAVDTEGNLGGFIKVDPWLCYPGGIPEKPDDNIVGKLNAIETGNATLGILETGSLVVDPKDQNHGLGTELKKQMATQASVHFPGVPVIAVITNDNGPSLHNNIKLGWIPIDNSILCKITGIDVLDGWVPESTIFVSPESIASLSLSTVN